MRKLFICLFIIWSIFVQIKFNFGLRFPEQYSPNINFLIGKSARLASLTSRWHMFARPLKYKWQFSHWAVFSDGSQRQVHLHPKQPRSFWQKHVTDFRDEKLTLNLYENSYALFVVSQYFCQNLSSVGLDVREIRTIIYWQMIKTPEDAEKTKQRYSRLAYEDYATIVCENRGKSH